MAKQKNKNPIADKKVTIQFAVECATSWHQYYSKNSPKLLTKEEAKRLATKFEMGSPNSRAMMKLHAKLAQANSYYESVDRKTIWKNLPLRKAFIESFIHTFISHGINSSKTENSTSSHRIAIKSGIDHAKRMRLTGESKKPTSDQLEEWADEWWYHGGQADLEDAGILGDELEDPTIHHAFIKSFVQEIKKRLKKSAGKK